METQKYIFPKMASRVILKEFATMSPGEGVWWKREGDCVKFLDGDDDLCVHAEGPLMMMFESKTLSDVSSYLEEQWAKKINSKSLTDLLILETGKLKILAIFNCYFGIL